MDLLLNRLILAALVLSLLTACGSNDPAVLRQQAASIERQYARATAESRAYQAEVEAQNQAATAQVQERDRLEIERLQVSGYATATAIMAEQDRLDIAIAQAQATQEAAEYNLAATSTAQAAQATQTALALAVAYEPTRIAQTQMRDDIINRGLSLSLVVLMVLLVVLALIIVAWLRNYLNWKIEWTDRKNSLFHTPDGSVKYQDGDMVLVRDDNYLRRQVRQTRETTDVTWITPSVATSDPAQRQDPLKIDALRLLEWVGEDGHIPGHREINWSSSTWQKAIGYFRALDLVEKSGDGWELRASAREVKYQLTSPTPNGGR